MTQERPGHYPAVSLYTLTISKPLHPYVRNTPASFARIPFLAANGALPEVTPTDDLVITESVRVKPGVYRIADEGEPGTFKDRFFLEREPHRFLEGMLLGVATTDVVAYAGPAALLIAAAATFAARGAPGLLGPLVARSCRSTLPTSPPATSALAG